MSDNDKISFQLSLVDKASAAAKDVEAALKALNKELGIVEKTKAFNALEHQRKQWEQNRKVIADFSSAVGKAIGVVMGLATAAGALAVSAELYSIKAADFQDRTLGALSAMEGGDEAARATLKSLQAGANAAGLRTGDVTKFYTELKNAGFQVQEIQGIMAGGFDVGAIMGDPGAAMRVIETLKGARTKLTMDTGSFEGLGIGTLTEYGKALAAVEPKYAKFATMTERQMRLAMDGGQIEASRGSDAILKLIQTKFNKGGALGSSAKKFGGGSLEGQLNNLHNQIDSIFADAAVKGPLLDAMKSLGTLLDGSTATGKEMRAVLGGAFKSIAETIAKFATPKNLKELVETLTNVAKVSWDVTSAFFKGLYAGFMAVAKPVKEVWDAIHPGTTDLKALATVAGVVGGAIGGLAAVLGVGLVASLALAAATFALVAAPFVVAGAGIAATLAIIAVALAPIVAVIAILAAPFVAIGYAVVWLVDQLAKLAAWFTGGTVWKDVATFFEGVGKNIVTGLKSGIKAAKDALLGDTVALGQGMQDALKGNLKVHSPSRVFQRIGEFTVLGLVEGINAQNDNAQFAMAEVLGPMVEAPPPVASSQISVGGGGGGGRAPVTINLTINVNGGGAEAKTLASNIAGEVRREMIRLLDGARLSDGGEYAEAA